MDVFANNLTRYMAYYNMTQMELAEKLGISSSSVSLWQSGNTLPRMAKVDQMCDIFHCSRSDLLEKPQTDYSIKRSTLLKELNQKIETLNDEGLEKIITTIDDLSERYKEWN